MMIVEGCDIFDFKLYDDFGHEHYYTIAADDFKSARKVAEKDFAKRYGYSVVGVEENVSGYPRTEMV